MRSSTTERRGFTLVELLVVIAIIATLAAILTPAVMIALDSAYKARIKLEVTKITKSLEDYKNKHNDYPPDFSEPATVKRHFRRAFPKMGRDEQVVLEHMLTEETIDRAEALFFALHGFSSDVTHPFTGPGGPLAGTDASSFSIGDQLVGSEGLKNSLINFNESKIAWSLNPTTSSYESTDDADPFPTYKQEGTETPFVYFDSRSYVYNDPNNNPKINSFQDDSNPLAGIAQPYKLDEPIPKQDPDETGLWNTIGSPPNEIDPKSLKFASADKYQIISAGPDGKFSPLTVDIKDARVFPTGTNYKTEDNDNVVNFNTASTLEGDLP